MARRWLSLLLLPPLLGPLLLLAYQLQIESQAERWVVPIAGFDPRDPLRGHYLRFRYEWLWQTPDATLAEPIPGCLCLSRHAAWTAAVPLAAARPTPCEDPAPTCAAVLTQPTTIWLDRRCADGSAKPARHRHVNYDLRKSRIYIAEAKAAEWEDRARDPREALAITLMVLPDGRARIGDGPLILTGAAKQAVLQARSEDSCPAPAARAIEPAVGP